MPKFSEIPAGADADFRDTDTVVLTQPTAPGATTYRQRRYPASKFRGAAGPKGDKGDAGTQGPQGIQGVPGPAGSGTGTSFTAGRSVSLVGGTLNAGGYYNVRSFGAVGDGQSRPLSSVTTFRGGSTAGWTLAQWQAVMPHVTALSNQLDWACVQDAVRVAKASGGGTVYVPTGGYVMSDTLVLAANPTTHLQGDGTASLLHWPNDLGPGRVAIRADDPGAIESFLQIADLRIQGNFNAVPIGTRPYQMHGVELDRVMRLFRCFIRGFNAGASILNDHQQIAFCVINFNYYGIYFGDDTDVFGNQYIMFTSLVENKFAGIGIGGSRGTMDMVSMYSMHYGFEPYGIYREPTPAGKTVVMDAMTGCTMTDIFMEACGNGGIFDENTDSAISGNVFINFKIDMNPWGEGRYRIPSRPPVAGIRAGRWTLNQVLGNQELVGAGTAYGQVTQAAVVCASDCAGNEWGNVQGWLDNTFGGKPYLRAGGSCEGNTWRKTGLKGVFSALVNQAAPVPPGTLMQAFYGTQQTIPWVPGRSLVLGALQTQGLDGTLVPIATEGLATVRKTPEAMNLDARVVASLGTPGAAEVQNPGTASAFIGVVAFQTAAADATVLVRLALHNPRYVGNVPTLTYSRAGETAAAAQLRAAMVAQGLAVDATTA